MRILEKLSGIRMQNIFSILVLMLLLSGNMFSQLTDNLKGHYKGNAKIIVNWSKQKSLDFDLQIDPSGKVTGRVGEATIIKAKVEDNTFGSSQFIIEARIEGYLIEEEKIQRKWIKIIFDIEGGDLIGGFHTSGSSFGGKEKMKMSGTDMILKKQ